MSARGCSSRDSAPDCWARSTCGFRRACRTPTIASTAGGSSRSCRLIQETPADKILAAAVEKLKSGTTLDDLVAAAALANARTFGGEDYVGFHCEMAMMPARLMASRMADRRLAPLPVLKVLYRNSVRLQQEGGREREVLRRTTPDPKRGDAAALLAAERAGDTKAAEAAFAEISKRGPEPAYDAMQDLVRDNPDVHQVVLAWRAWDL